MGEGYKMAEVRFVVIEVWQGEEDILRSRYAVNITTGGVWRNADGVKRAFIPVDTCDVSGAKKFDDAMKKFKEIREVKFEVVKD